jgi:nucleoside-diphosphate-sugar epimerase
MTARPSVIVTGIAGHLGQRLLPLLNDCAVLGFDIHEPPAALQSARFEKLDLGQESSCRRLIDLLCETHAVAVVHLAFVIDPVRTGVLDRNRMWQINVAGTARVMEAITEVNRAGSGSVTKLIFPSSVSAYGSELPYPVTEDYPLGAHTLPYAIHKQEADEVVRARAPALGACTTYLLRPPIFAGATMQNYLVGSLRGTPGGKSRIAEWLRAYGVRLPLVLPRGNEYLVKRFQFVHVDDMARLVAWILHLPDRGSGLIALNVAGRGDAITLRMAARTAGQHMIRLPSPTLCRWMLALLWNLRISSVPPEALPYIIGSYLMDTSRLRAFLGRDYEEVIQYTSERALQDTFSPPGADKRAITSSGSA